MTYTEATADSVLETEFRVGKVVSTSWSIFLRNIISFTMISAAAALPVIPIGLAMRSGVVALDRWVAVGIAVSLWYFFSAFTTAIILQATLQHMRGRPVRLTEAISRGLSRFVKLFGVMLLQAAGILFGLVLIVPGIMLAAMWYVAVPVCVVENAGPVQCLKHSAALTKGYRWKIFALLLLFYGGTTAVYELIAWAASPIGSAGIRAIIDGIGNCMGAAFGSVLITVAYYHLRVAKEGVDVEQIAAVFD